MKLQKNVTPLEEEMSVFRDLTDEISKLKEIVLALAKETTERKTYATVYTMYQKEHRPDCPLSYIGKTDVDANVKKIYRDINNYTKWLKWKQMKEENGEKLKWSEWYEDEGPRRKNNDDCYLLRE